MYVFAAFWGLVCAWAVIKGFNLRSWAVVGWLCVACCALPGESEATSVAGVTTGATTSPTVTYNYSGYFSAPTPAAVCSAWAAANGYVCCGVVATGGGNYNMTMPASAGITSCTPHGSAALTTVTSCSAPYVNVSGVCTVTASPYGCPAGFVADVNLDGSCNDVQKVGGGCNSGSSAAYNVTSTGCATSSNCSIAPASLITAGGCYQGCEVVASQIVNAGADANGNTVWNVDAASTGRTCANGTVNSLINPTSPTVQCTGGQVVVSGVCVEPSPTHPATTIVSNTTGTQSNGTTSVTTVSNPGNGIVTQSTVTTTCVSGTCTTGQPVNMVIGVTGGGSSTPDFCVSNPTNELCTNTIAKSVDISNQTSALLATSSAPSDPSAHSQSDIQSVLPSTSSGPLASLLAWTLPTTSSSCPTVTLSGLSGLYSGFNGVTFASHCTLLASVQTLVQSIMVLGFVLIAMFVVLSA